MDGHELAALCAPRPVFIGSGSPAGGHTDGPNWPAFLTFAEHYFKGPGLKPTAFSEVSPNKGSEK